MILAATKTLNTKPCQKAICIADGHGAELSGGTDGSEMRGNEGGRRSEVCLPSEEQVLARGDATDTWTNLALTSNDDRYGDE